MKCKYSDWLLVSDIDGTLNDKKRKLPPNNKVAINRFVENGGKFTLCSGRNLQSLSIHYNKLGIKTPAIFLNGAGIYDFDKKELIHYSPISDEGEEIILDIYKKFKGVQLTIFDVDMVYLVKRTCLYGYILSKIDKLDYSLCDSIEALPRGVWGKVTFFGFRKTLKEIQSIIQNDENQKYFECFFTSPFSLEIVKKGVNKGSAVSILSKSLNIDSKNVGAIGDYYNDVEMLKAVAHPFCCGQAPDDIKSLSEHVVCHCNDGAVCEFINYIENKYIL